MSKRESTLPAREGFVGDDTWVVELELAESLARQAGFSDDYIDSFDGDQKRLIYKAALKLSSKLS